MGRDKNLTPARDRQDNMEIQNYQIFNQLEGRFVLSAYPQVGIIILWDQNKAFEVLSIHSGEIIDCFKSYSVRGLDDAKAASSQYIAERYKNYIDRFNAF